jgi:hypothetical protein
VRVALLPLFLFAACSSSANVSLDAGVPRDMSLGAPTTVATTSTLTSCLAVDATALYWSDATPAIMTAPLAGGAATQLYAGGDPSTCVAVDGNGVYFFEGDKLMNAKGGAHALASGQHLLKGAPLVAAGGYVYWVTDVYGNVDAYNGMNAIVRLSTATPGTPEVVTATLNGAAGGLAVDDTNVYYSDGNGVFARPLAAPSTSIPFGMSALHANAIAVGGGHLAMNEISGLNAGDVAVFRLDGMGRTVVGMMQARPLAVDDSGVYVNDGALERLALDGSGGKLLATMAPRAVALTGGSIFFTDGSAIFSLPK